MNLLTQGRAVAGWALKLRDGTGGQVGPCLLVNMKTSLGNIRGKGGSKRGFGAKTVSRNLQSCRLLEGQLATVKSQVRGLYAGGFGRLEGIFPESVE